MPLAGLARRLKSRTSKHVNNEVYTLMQGPRSLASGRLAEWGYKKSFERNYRADADDWRKNMTR